MGLNTNSASLEQAQPISMKKLANKIASGGHFQYLLLNWNSCSHGPLII